MEEKNILNTVAILTGALDALNRAGKMEAVDEIALKILELVKKI